MEILKYFPPVLVTVFTMFLSNVIPFAKRLVYHFNKLHSGAIMADIKRLLLKSPEVYGNCYKDTLPNIPSEQTLTQKQQLGRKVVDKGEFTHLDTPVQLPIKHHLAYLDTS